MDIDDILSRSEFHVLKDSIGSEISLDSDDSILKKKEFKSLDTYLDFQMIRYTTVGVYDHMISTFDGDYYKARDWFYSKIKALGDKRPYDYCILGRQEKVDDVLGAINWGLYS
jgi:hypothetical protein